MNGLAALVQEQLRRGPFSGVIHVFRAKRADRIRLLFWDGTGLVLATKRLEQGTFAWPKIADGVMRLSAAQLAALVEGLGWRRVQARRVPAPRAAQWSPRHGESPRAPGARKRVAACSSAGMITCPDPLPADAAALRALLLAERARHAAELAAATVAAGEAARARDLAHGEIERLRLILQELQRHRFGRRAESLGPDQLALALEDLEQTLAAAEAAQEEAAGEAAPAAQRIVARRRNRGALPADLPREEVVLDIKDKACPCCGGALHAIGEA
jgi:transposase